MLEYLKQYTDSEFLKTIIDLIPILLVFFIGLLVIKILMKLVDRSIRKSKLERSLHTFIRTTIKIILYFILVLVLADMVNIPITSLVAAFSVVGLAISLSIQNTLSNVASGIMLLLTKPFVVGDYVDAGGTSGTVTDIGFVHLKLKTVDNKIIFIPNGQITTDKIVNYSTAPNRRVDISVSVSYKNDGKLVKETLNKLIANNELILKDEDIFIGITKYLDSAVEYTLRVWTKNEDYWTVYLELLEKIKVEFDKNNIEIPYNQMDVHIVKE